MKYLLITLLLAASLRAASATATVTFDPGNAPDPLLEYVVEEKAGTAWVEVGKAAASPIVYTRSIPFGNYTLRLFVRGLWAGWVRDVASDTSSEFSTVMKPFPPSNGKVILGKPISYNESKNTKGYVLR